MIRLIAISLLAGALAVGCSGTGPVGSPSLPADGAAAQAQLCSTTGDTSLTGLADRLESVDTNTDTTQLQVALGTVSANLSQVSVSGDQTAARDAALSAVQAVQGALADPNTLAEVATSASSALRQLQGSLC